MSMNLISLPCVSTEHLQTEQNCQAGPHKKKRVRRVEMELNELQEQLQRKAEELQRAEAESLRLRQRLKVRLLG